jgi:drug/metabolite transporter (DMT)-like permease
MALDDEQTSATLAVMSSTLFWAGNVMVADLASKQVDCMDLTIGEFMVVIVLTMSTALMLEPGEWTYPFTAMTNNWKVAVIVGCFDGFAYILSTIGQMFVRPSRASILYSGIYGDMSCVTDLITRGDAIAGTATFTCVVGYLVLREMLSDTELFGGVLMIVAAFISSEDDEEFEREHHPEAPDGQCVTIEMQPPGYGALLTTEVILQG